MTSRPRHRARCPARCAISADRLVADCRIGKGRATIVADADFIDPQDLGEGAEHNLDAMLSELRRLRIDSATI